MVDTTKVTMTLRDYLETVKSHMNRELSLNLMILPFGLEVDIEVDRGILVGHVVEELMSRFKPADTIDCLDVAAAAWELGHEPAGAFLDEAPYRMFAAIRARGVESGLH
jgi:hypothetical protein